MDNRLAQKFARHRREGVTYPNPGAARTLGLTPEQERFSIKMARHQAAIIAEEALDQANEPELPAPAKAEPSKSDEKGSVSKRG